MFAFETGLNNFKHGFAVIGHRGARAYYPENTLISFRAAVEMQADMLELDVQLTKDDVPVIYHDTKLNTMTDGKGRVADYLFRDLRKLDAGSHLDKKFKGEQIPTLREVLELAKDKIPVNIEIKTEAVKSDEDNHPVKSVEHQVVELVTELRMKDEVMISSFDYRAICRIKTLAPDIYTAVLYDKKNAAGLNPVELVNEYGVNAFNCDKRELTGSWVELLTSNHIPFFIYTVNSEKALKKVLDAGANGVFTDKPDVMREAADRYFEAQK